MGVKTLVATMSRRNGNRDFLTQAWNGHLIREVEAGESGVPGSPRLGNLRSVYTEYPVSFFFLSLSLFFFFLFCFVFCFFVCFLSTGFLCVALAGLELTL